MCVCVCVCVCVCACVCACVCVCVYSCVRARRQCEEQSQRLSVLEESFSSAQQEVCDLRGVLREVERSRLEARRELQEQRRQVGPPGGGRRVQRSCVGVGGVSRSPGGVGGFRGQQTSFLHRD